MLRSCWALQTRYTLRRTLQGLVLVRWVYRLNIKYSNIGNFKVAYLPNCIYLHSSMAVGDRMFYFNFYPSGIKFYQVCPYFTQFIQILP